ncbi:MULTISPECIES: ATP-binding cassette domain-containing protein [Gordonia]|uniref:ATP-binding cassette domain-containing protein n=1 Tax=Gordonia TaxID=2053 RepID=UPI00339ADDED
MPGRDRSSPIAVEAVGLTKSLGRGDNRVPVLRGLDLEVAAGEVVALLGPNGAGKTTTVRILSTLTRPDGGTARVGGFDVATQRRRVREIISLTGQYAAVDDKLTGRENLTMMGRLAHHRRPTVDSRVDELLIAFDLTDAADRLVSTYSGGMRRRLDLAAGLLDRPVVLFLDEPTTGLDPRSRQMLWQVIDDVVAQGTAVLLTTQYLEEADRLADRVALISGGRIGTAGTPDELKRRVGEAALEFVVPTPAEAAALAHDLAGFRPSVQANTVRVPTDRSVPHTRAILETAERTAVTVASWELRSPTLDDVFLAATGQTAAPANDVEVAA